MKEIREVVLAELNEAVRSLVNLDCVLSEYVRA